MSEAVADRRACAPGSWYAVLGERVTVLLPPDHRDRVVALWDLVDAGADFDEVLDGLLVGGLRGLPAFALVEHAGDRTRVLVRGGASARFATAAGEVIVRAHDGDVWAERTLTGVTGGVLDVEAAAAPAGLVGGVGIARVSQVVLGAEPAAGQAAGPPAATPVPEPVPVPDPVPEPVPVSEPESVAAPEPEVPTEAMSAPLSFGAPEDDPTPTGETPVVPATPEHDGQTSAGPSPGRVDRPPHGIPGQPQAPAVTSRPVATMVFSTGEVVDVDRAILVGRAPEARRFASSDQPRLVTVASPHQEISSTHLEIRPGSGADHGMAVVTDLGSTNGTVLVQPGLPPEDLRAGIAVSLIPGAVLDLGDGVTVQTTNP